MLALYVLAEEVRDIDLTPPTAFAVEQPEDPRSYRSEAEVQEKGFMSMWRTQEWLNFQDRYNLRLISFDQGTMGHVKRKPTSIGTNLEELFDLDGLRGGGRSGSLAGEPKSIQQRCAESRSWAEWAIGLKKALAFVLLRWLDKDEAEPREVL